MNLIFALRSFMTIAKIYGRRKDKEDNIIVIGRRSRCPYIEVELTSTAQSGPTVS